MKTRVFKDVFRRITSMLLTTAITVCAVASYPANASAANNNKYISDVILYDGSAGSDISKEALEGEGYTFLEENLYDNVSLGYKVTDKADDAIRDIAVLSMDEKYYEGYFDQIVEKKETETEPLIEGLMTAVEEYRSNYKAGKERALEAYDLLNRYYEDDTGLKMGDFFLEESISKEQYVTLFMQANVRSLNAIEKVLAGATDTMDNTWVDRLVEYGTLETMIMQMVEDEENYPDVIDDTSALAYMEEQYLTDAQSIYNMWDSYSDALNRYKNADYHLTDGDVWKNYISELNATDTGKAEAIKLQETAMIYEPLKAIEYGSSDGEYNVDMDTDEDGENTLLDLFLKNTEEGSLGVEELYPLVAALSPGQRFIITVAGIDTLFGAAGEQCQDKLAAGELSEEVTDIEEIEALNKVIEKQQDQLLEVADNSLETFAKENKEVAKTVMDEDHAISVYAGVDRSFYQGGVAVTSRAYNSINAGTDLTESSFEKNWTLWDTINYVCLTLGFVSLFSGVIMFVENAPTKVINVTTNVADEVGRISISDGEAFYNIADMPAQTQTVQNAFHTAGAVFMAIGIVLLVAYLVSFFVQLSYSDKKENHYYDIPLKIADLSKGEDGMNPYLFYSAVQNQDGKAMDVYRWQKNNWLALYTTRSIDAGNPILETDFCKKVSSSDGVDAATYAGIHQFGSAAAKIISDGSENGVKLYFRHATASDMAASVFADNSILISMLCLVFGAFGGFFVGNARKRKEEVAL